MAPVAALSTYQEVPDDCVVVNAAVTLFAAVIVTVQVFPDEDVQPLQLEKVDPEDAAAVNVILVPELYEAEHTFPQLIPVPVTVPEPSPDLKTVREYVVIENTLAFR